MSDPSASPPDDSAASSKLLFSADPAAFRAKSATPLLTAKATGSSNSSSIRKSVSHNNVASVSTAMSSALNGATSSASSASPSAMWSHVGYHRTTIPPEATFDPQNAQIQKDLLGMIVQYLQQEGFTMSSATIQDEANVKLTEKLADKDALRRMTKAVLEGDWDVVSKLLHKNLKKFHAQQGFLYAVCKQEYLELIDRQEYQKAFTFLTTHLKPLEKIANMTSRTEFRDLCYLLTCKSVGEVDAFRDWDGVVRSREKLVEQLRSTFELDALVTSDDASASSSSARVEMPDNRLVTLLHQSVAYQMEFSRYHPKTIPRVTTLARDFECEVLPNAVKSTYVGHAQNVKYVTFVGQDGEFLASGSSDATIKLWPVDFPVRATSTEATASPSMGDVCATYSRELSGHSSRIWYLASNAAGDMLYSGSGDGTVKIWDLRSAVADLSAALSDGAADAPDALNSIRGATVSSSSNAAASALAATGSLGSSSCVATLQSQSGGDIYSVNVHPSETHVVTGGYDQTVRLFDIQSGAIAKTFRGHVASVCDAQFNRHANLIVSGSKDGTIRLWDILSGLCVHTLRQTLGEVTSVSMASNGYTLLSGSRNNSNRLWDLRMLHAPRAHLTTGHTSGAPGVGSSSSSSGASTTSHGFATNALLHSSSSGFATTRSSSSSAHEQRPIQRFKGHQNTAKNVVRASFGPREAFVLGGSEDGAVYVWDVATGKLLEKLAGHSGVTYNAKWHEKQALMASSSHDSTVKTWWWQDKTR